MCGIKMKKKKNRMQFQNVESDWKFAKRSIRCDFIAKRPTEYTQISEKQKWNAKQIYSMAKWSCLVMHSCAKNVVLIAETFGPIRAQPRRVKASPFYGISILIAKFASGRVFVQMNLFVLRNSIVGHLRMHHCFRSIVVFEFVMFFIKLRFSVFPDIFRMYSRFSVVFLFNSAICRVFFIAVFQFILDFFPIFDNFSDLLAIFPIFWRFVPILKRFFAISNDYLFVYPNEL